MFAPFLARFPPDPEASAGEPPVPRPPWPHGPVRGWDALMGTYAGRSFAGGIYRLHSEASGRRADRLVAGAIPWLARRAYCFGYDWLGRQFSVNDERFEGDEPLVLMIDLEEGRAYRIPATFRAFHERILLDDTDVTLGADLFESWARANPGLLPLGPEQVVGYRIPLALGGRHELGNLALSYLEVEAGFAAQIYRQLTDDPAGSPPPPPVPIGDAVALDSPHGRFLAEELADLGLDPALPPAALRERLRAALADLGADVALEAEGPRWRARLPEHDRAFVGRSPEAALAWAFLFLQDPEEGPAPDDDR